jgi:(R,R)-butanediol dehydrogenase / meso-butanediol dehydrogenase / diacetyl reductase
VRAAVFHGGGDIRTEEVADPAPGRGELLLRIHASGICGTDADEYAHGPRMFPAAPHIPGHELSGEVVALGAEVSGFAEGDFVVSGAGISCGRCWQCERGLTNLCESYHSVGLQRDGGLAQLCALPAATCIAVPDGLSRDAATLAQPMSIGTHAMRRGRLQPGEDAVVVGAGGIGAFLAYAAASTGARVVVLDLDEERLAQARELGARHAWVPDDDLAERMTQERIRPAVVYEVSGTRGGLRTAADVLPAGGRLVLVGLQAGHLEEPLRSLTLLEHEVIGTNAHVLRDDLPEALRLLAGRAAPWSDVAPLAISLDRLVPDGIEPLAAHRTARIKTIVDPWAERSRHTMMGEGDR